ncbi:DUF2867 domain-containing protein [Mesobacterium pallidum]|uniref:DUF2867 domain-containing protein n=1 Tax=Mesobacterium pallidum TaxID=2872037 RepID=UPI001EE32381|nr:DUF2867 domain-containing protein [Mesobacterium pallidum]
MPLDFSHSRPEIRKEPHPQVSQLWRLVQPGDFIDGYSVESGASVAEAVQTGLSLPGWADALLALRNALMKPFGLKTEVSDAPSGIFPVLHDSDVERILGTNDKHLDFRISILRQAGRIHMATWVHPHNLGGRAYLTAVMPFHVAITRNALARVARAYPA